MATLSRSAYAQHRADKGLTGGRLSAVQKAIKSGRIHLEADGRINSKRADSEWADGTGQEDRAHQKPVASPSDPAPDLPPRQRPPPKPSAPNSEAGDRAYVGMSLVDASAIEKVHKANLAELEYREQLGELVSAAAVASKLAGLFTLCRTKLLGVPTRARQALPHLTTKDLATIERLQREALEELSGTILEVESANG
jgi:hypothetical protein